MAFLGLWSHAVAALLFAALALWQVRSPKGGARKIALIAALAASALWALAMAGTDSASDASAVAESVRNLGFLGFMYALLHQGGRERRSVALATVYGVVALVALATIMFTILTPPGNDAHPAAIGGYALRMMVATGALVLVHNLYSAAGPDTGPGFRVAIHAIAAMWLYDLNLYAIAYLGSGWPEDVAALRGLVAVGVAAMLGLGLHQSGAWTLQLSRTMTFRTLSLAAIGLYLIAMVLVTSGIALIGGDHARLAQAAFVFGTSAAALALPSARARAWIKVKLAKHLFQHRYDYRAEWLRFTDTLGKPGEDTAPLAERVVKAVADITDSPEGLLFVPEGEGLAAAARWNWPAEDTPPGDLGAGLVAYLASGHIVELDAARREGEDTATHALLPQWLIDDVRAWVLVPLVHFDRVAGAVVLGRPPLDRALDWEDFDLLRVAGRQVASYLAESQGQQALDDARRFDEFNRRFAFIMHDIKNLVSQLSLVARNAERHADNPEFRADMVATLKDSADRMNALLARLAQHNSARSEAPRPVPADEVVAGLVATKRLLHPVSVGRTAGALVLADPQRLETLLGHLVQNAIDASAPEAPVRIDVRVEGHEVAIDVIDHGCGMSPAFVREKLFTAFASTKPGGFGVGAYEARQLVRAMGGRMSVASREGEGSRFTVILPLAQETREKAA
ncbi:PEP-CTERM system histidine kinase PrsK [Sphingomonas gilva]|uniref:histidine kinase n=1 Tax=Sphingomonas gilva TaxID=2305907 RepID=A0A396RNE3_9SPHN|nr:XrtA/PEP-CTERM system histidine kinase PrsK [Sphingomonas gilva]RHW18017.1 PEP-CTERM system histidine kinase PrsK [Sphingomonas gilva]